MRLVNELRNAIAESSTLQDATEHVASFVVQHRAIDGAAYAVLMEAFAACHNIRRHTHGGEDGCERCRAIARKNALVEMYAILTDTSAETVYMDAEDDLQARHEVALAQRDY